MLPALHLFKCGYRIYIYELWYRLSTKWHTQQNNTAENPTVVNLIAVLPNDQWMFNVARSTNKQTFPNQSRNCLENTGVMAIWNPPFQYQLQIRQLLRLHFKHNIVFHDSCGIQSWYYVITTSQVYNCAPTTLRQRWSPHWLHPCSVVPGATTEGHAAHCVAFSQVPGDAMNIGGMGWHWYTSPLYLPWFNATLRRITYMLREMRVSHGFRSKCP